MGLAQVTGTVFPGPEHVGKYPAGASPFGVLDMIGSVWQMTDEYQDTRAPGTPPPKRRNRVVLFVKQCVRVVITYSLDYQDYVCGFNETKRAA